MTGELGGVLLTVLLLAANAFFVGAEFALVSSRRDRLEALVAQGRPRARKVLDATEHLSLMMAASQLGITICSILLGKVGEPAVAHLLEPVFSLLHVPEPAVHPTSFVVALSLVVVLHVLLGEMVPKNIAIAGPETTALYLVPPHLLFCAAAKPLIWFCNFSANAVLRMVGIEPKDELDAAVTPAELNAMLSDSRSSGLLDAEEHRRLTRALDTEDRTVDEVMIPFDTVRSVRITSGGVLLEDVRREAAETGFSRYPVLEPDGSVTGYVHIKDVLEEIAAGGPTDRLVAADAIHPMPALVRDTRVEDALGELRRTSSHMGLVTGSEGATVGIVALEDLLEEFVGTVRDGTHRRRGRA